MTTENYEAPPAKGLDRLYTRAVVYRTLYRDDPQMMCEQFAAEVMDDPQMLIGLLGGEEAARAAATRYLLAQNTEPPAPEGGRGQIRVADKALGKLPRPPNEPSRDYVKAALRARIGSAISVFDTYRVRDGRKLGTLTHGELPRLIERGAKEDWLLLKLYQTVQAPPDTLLSEALKEAEVESLLAAKPNYTEVTEYLKLREAQRG